MYVALACFLAKGDVMKPGGQQPYAFLPLNPRLLGKKQHAKARETIRKMMPKKGKVRQGVAGGRGRTVKHGINARRATKS